MNRLNRRQFLKGLGGYTLALPFLPSLLPQGAKAATGDIKRFIAICTLDGYFEPTYYPSAELDVKVAEDIYYRKLASITGNMTEAHGNFFDPFRDKMNIYRGLDILPSNSTLGMFRFGHGRSHMLTAARRAIYGDFEPDDPIGNSISMDNVLIRSKRFYPNPPAIPAIRAAGWGNQTISYDRTSTGEVFKHPAVKTNAELFNQVFGNLTLDPTAKAELDSKRMAIGDLVLEDLKRKQNSRRISSVDKVVLTEFVDEVHQLQQRIQSNFGKVCQEPSINEIPSPPGGDIEGIDLSLRKQMYKDYMDIITAAFKCDLTRVANITFARSFFKNFHSNSHKYANVREAQLKYVEWNLAFSEVVAYLLHRLDSELDSNGTFLDNSIVFWGSDISEGQAHSAESMPAISFGSAGGAINTGYYIDYRQRPFFYPANRTIEPAVGRCYTQLLITFMKALGLEPEDYHKYGDGGGFGSFDDDGPYKTGRYAAYEKFRNDPLPVIYKG